MSHEPGSPSRLVCEIDAAVHALTLIRGYRGLPAYTVTLLGNEPCVLIQGHAYESLATQRPLVLALAQAWDVEAVLSPITGGSYSSHAQTVHDGVQIIASAAVAPHIGPQRTAPPVKTIAIIKALQDTRAWIQTVPTELVEELVVADDGSGVRLLVLAHRGDDGHAVAERLLAGLPTQRTDRPSGSVRGHAMLPTGLPVTLRI